MSDPNSTNSISTNSPSTDEDSESQVTFESLGLSEVTLAAIKKAGYEYPSPVQAGVIPHAITGKDVLGQARTGTGKTASFAIPILEGLDPDSDKPQALIVVPTRELAVQVDGEVTKLAHGRDFRCVTAYGGKPIRGQIDRLKKGVQVVVGTPGRLLDLMARRAFDPSGLQIVVLDEADRMLDIGFRPDIEKILRGCPQSRQTLLLSATLPKPILQLAQKYMTEPVNLDFSEKDIAVSTIDQYYFTVHPKKKFELLRRLLEQEKPQQAIIFCRTKHGTEKTYQRLKKKLGAVGVMHGDMAQGARNRTMAEFRDETIQILVATDVIGRGIDVTNVSHIINYDVPQFSDDYVHRVGRTGRMGREGVAYTFVTLEQGGELTKIEIRIDKLLKKAEIDGFDPQEFEERPRTPEAAAEDGLPPEPPPKPLYGRRGPKKYRRAP